MLKQHYGQDLGLSHEEMESLQLTAESSQPVRPGGDDGPAKVERTPSVRTSVVEHGPLEASTPQGEDPPSPFGSQSFPNTVLMGFLQMQESCTCYCIISPTFVFLHPPPAG